MGAPLCDDGRLLVPTGQLTAWQSRLVLTPLFRVGHDLDRIPGEAGRWFV